ncbi:hypothetical protein H4R18_004672 [Coemansia javaensis]|uniref:CST complex subunit STN1 n=1 Tax=Coemansia javaensis TaxID=2761396 RepID=A0A9W8LGR3_9FUNG|nr:hypothetical protein H4R18_004672 [Coemansia javaensis]
MNLDNRACTRPAEDWGLDPLFWVPAKLFVGDLLRALPSASGSVFFVGNQRAVRSVELVGVVVSVDARSPKMVAYVGKVHVVDDGTGVILCVHFAAQGDPDAPPRQEHGLGTTVCVEGRLATFRGERQVVIREMRAVGPNHEVAGWLERLSLRALLATAPPP